MSARSLGISEPLQGYLIEHSSGPDTVLQELARETLERFPESSEMQIAPEQGGFLELLARLVRARFAVEVGTFTGYSAICIARGLTGDGRLLCIDRSEEWTGVARRYWSRAGVDDRIELRLGEAAEVLPGLPGDPPVDLAFIDADKAGYPAYYEELLTRLSPSGLIVVDSVLSGGRVLEPGESGTAAAIAGFNARVVADERVDVVMLPVADGLSLITPR